MTIQLTIDVMPDEYAITRLDTHLELPRWAEAATFWSVSRDDEEYTIICKRTQVPSGFESDGDWACLKLKGTFGFDEAGILLAAVRPISESGFGVFVVSTFKRDYILVKRQSLPDVERLLTNAGHSISERS